MQGITESETKRTLIEVDSMKETIIISVFKILKYVLHKIAGAGRK